MPLPHPYGAVVKIDALKTERIATSPPLRSSSPGPLSFEGTYIDLVSPDLGAPGVRKSAHTPEITGVGKHGGLVGCEDVLCFQRIKRLAILGAT